MASQLTLKIRLLKWLKAHPAWIASGELQRLVSQTTDYSPSNVTRRLRELETAQEIEVEYRKGHAWYRAKPATPSFQENNRQMIEDFDRLPVPTTN